MPPGRHSALQDLVAAGDERIAWAERQMPVLRAVSERFIAERPLAGLRIAACLHVTAETANLVRALRAGGAELALCAANPLSTQEDVAVALGASLGVEVHAERGEDRAAYARNLETLVAGAPGVLVDDGAELIVTAHAAGAAQALIGATEETTTGLVRLRAMASEGSCSAPCSRRTRCSPSACSTIATALASLRSTASFVPPTYCSPGARLS